MDSNDGAEKYDLNPFGHEPMAGTWPTQLPGHKSNDQPAWPTNPYQDFDYEP